MTKEYPRVKTKKSSFVAGIDVLNCNPIPKKSKPRLNSKRKITQDGLVEAAVQPHHQQ